MASWTFGGGGATNSYQAGPGQAGPKLGLYKEESIQTSSIGLPLEFEDGRKFRYSHFVAAVTVGKLVAQDISATGTASLDAAICDSAGTAKDDYGTDDDAIYVFDSDIFPTTVAANAFGGGYFHITDAAGEGYQYRISSSAAVATAGILKLTLYDKFEAALDSETSYQITGNPHRNLITATAATDAIVCGVTARGMTIAYYGWVQTWGVATVLGDESAGTIAKGTIATLSDGVNGAAQPIGGGFSSTLNSETVITTDLVVETTFFVTEPIIGFFLGAAVDTEYTPIFLQIS